MREGVRKHLKQCLHSLPITIVFVLGSYGSPPKLLDGDVLAVNETTVPFRP